jgi:hypothetical protein
VSPRRLTRQPTAASVSAQPLLISTKLPIHTASLAINYPFFKYSVKHRPLVSTCTGDWQTPRSINHHHHRFNPQPWLPESYHARVETLCSATQRRRPQTQITSRTAPTTRERIRRNITTSTKHRRRNLRRHRNSLRETCLLAGITIGKGWRRTQVPRGLRTPGYIFQARCGRGHSS